MCPCEVGVVLSSCPRLRFRTKVQNHEVSQPTDMNASQETSGLAVTTVCFAFGTTAASLPSKLTRSAKAPVTSEFSGQYRPDHKPMNPL